MEGRSERSASSRRFPYAPNASSAVRCMSSRQTRRAWARISIARSETHHPLQGNWWVSLRSTHPTAARRANQSKPVKSPREKYFCLSETKISVLISPSHPARGACARHERAVGCDGRKAATDERGFGVRQKRVVPTPRCWRQVIALDPPGSMRMATVAKEPFTGEITP